MVNITEEILCSEKEYQYHPSDDSSSCHSWDDERSPTMIILPCHRTVKRHVSLPDTTRSSSTIHSRPRHRPSFTSSSICDLNYRPRHTFCQSRRSDYSRGASIWRTLCVQTILCLFFVWTRKTYVALAFSPLKTSPQQQNFQSSRTMSSLKTSCLAKQTMNMSSGQTSCPNGNVSCFASPVSFSRQENDKIFFTSRSRIGMAAPQTLTMDSTPTLKQPMELIPSTRHGTRLRRKKESSLRMMFDDINGMSSPSRAFTFRRQHQRGSPSSLHMAKETNDPATRQEVAQAEERLKQRARRVQTLERTLTKDEQTLLRQKHSLKDEEPIMYRVILHNDQVHTFAYVVQSLVKVVGIFTRATAYEIVVEAHRNNKSTIVRVWKEKAQQFCLGLQRQGLTVSIVPDYEFERGKNVNGNKNGKEQPTSGESGMSDAEIRHEMNQ